LQIRAKLLPLICIGVLLKQEDLMATTEILAAIDEEIARLQQVKNLLGGYESGNGRVKTQAGPRIKTIHGQRTANGSVAPKRVLSPEARKRIANAQKKRWAAHRKAAKA
jgi:hypothetical protein